MIELLFAAALMDTVIAQPVDNVIEVHEWGAVTFTQEHVTFGADPATDPEAPVIMPEMWTEPVARAPVVYFYGEPFSGTFTVSLSGGDFIELYPQPDTHLDTSPMPELPSSSATWTISFASPADDGGRRLAAEISCIGPELLNLWRQPPSHELEFSDGGSESFIYYECTLTPLPEGMYYPVVQGNDGPELDSEYRGEMLLFTGSGDGIAAQLKSDSGTEDIQLDDIPGILCGWAGGAMKTQEIEALWGSWEDWVISGEWSGETLLVFHLPQSTVESITSIQLNTDEYSNVYYRRFYLGMISQ